MCKKIFVFLFAFLAVFAVCWCFAFDIVVSAADSQISVSLSSNRNTGSNNKMKFESEPNNNDSFTNWFSPMISAWGNPVGYLNDHLYSVGDFSWEFTFTPSSSYTYVIFPRYVLHYGSGNTDEQVVFTSATPAIGAGDWELVDSRTLENISDGSVTVDYSWELYRSRYSGTANSFILTCYGNTLGLSGTLAWWSFPIFSPKAYLSDGGGSGGETSSGGGSGGETSSGGGSGGETSSGGGSGDCQQWNELNQRLDNIELYLNGIGWDLSELNDKLFDETYKDWEVSQAQSKYDKAESDVNSIIDAMSIPALDYIPQKPNIPGSGSGDGTIGSFMDFVGGLWWISVPLVTACGCWVASLILYGKHDVK